jgi:hypothetical protein
MPIIVTDASRAFCHLDHWGANKRTRWNHSALPQAVPSTTTMNSPRFSRAAHEREHCCWDPRNREPLQALELFYPGGWRPSNISD